MKSGSLPAKADVKRQSEFFNDTLNPLMTKAGHGGEALLFLDASHFVMGCDFLGFIYGKTRRFVKSFSGRLRYNVLGAIDFVTKEVVTITNDTYITATEVCQLLRDVSSKYAGKSVHIILDNARYQKCKVVQSLAEELSIDLVYIPPYSPNLNLIERLWKFVKNELRTKYYEDFTLFCHQIDGIIASTSAGNREKIASLIGTKVQLFDDLMQINSNTYVNNTLSRQASSCTHMAA